MQSPTDPDRAAPRDPARASQDPDPPRDPDPARVPRDPEGRPPEPWPPEAVPAEFRRVRIAGLSVIDGEPASTARALIAAMAAGARLKVAYFNANLVIQMDRAGMPPEALDGFTILNDGIAASLAARRVSGRGFAHNLNGTDFTPRLLAMLPAGCRVFLYGARAEVVAAAAARVDAMGPLEVAGHLDGYSAQGAEAARIVAAARPDVVVVALGNPAQEAWIAAHAETVGAGAMIGVGALFDFLAGRVTRAPGWVQAARLEWAWRLAQEPRRLVRRYTLDMAAFFRVVRAREGGAKRSG
jgi:beta-1,4-glucosyltransferase